MSLGQPSLNVVRDGDLERVSLLGRPWRLREVRDVEAFARGILDAKLQRRGARLRSDLYDEAVCFLPEVAVLADRSYDSSRCGSWERYMGWKLSNGVTDFYRGAFGRTVWKFEASTHTRPRPDLLSLEHSAREGELDRAFAREQGEPEVSRIDLQRALSG